ncbi:MAG: asparagine synthase (glutamine-hydrolyzing) [Alphaproteobacteria bacterium]|nr:asparagine synthase (glutamine-hydrolyzing) [Alphaproteobacteria bacterium]
MCGIAGLMTPDGASAEPAILDAMAAALAHRGPDGGGRHVAGNLGMVHTRLAIIDLESGDQPLYGDGGLALVANGEIYNYVELRDSLSGVAFATGSDCETPLPLYRRHELDYADHLRGMYAIALHDPARGRLVLSRDPFGIKPLYYAETGKGLAFASEPQALIAAGLVSAAEHAAARDELLQLQFSTGRETPLAGVMRVLPGETLVVEGGRIVARRRQSALPEGPPEEIEEGPALERLDTALEDSVRLHQRADVPYGMFLSGGIDSSALLAMMARVNETPVRAFTVGFPGSAAADERDHARHLAKLTGAEHVEVEFSEDDFWGLLPRLASAMDDPAADYAVLPTYKLAHSAAGEGLKVVLSGEGGDELLAGYGRYRSVLRPFWLGGRVMRARGIFDGLGVFNREPGGWRDGIAAAEIHAQDGSRSKLQTAQATDCADWLPNDLLAKLDRCLMHHGVEGRTPFLDREVAHAVFRLPDSLKIRKGLGKWILRRWLDQHLPEAKPFARKRGFTVPVGEWIAREGARLGPLVAQQQGVAALCDKSAVTALFARAGRKRAGHAAWTLLFYALWHRAHIQGLPPQGGVFESLGAKG